MDSTAKEVTYKHQAEQSIISIAQYITEKGYPETAKKFAEKLYEFGNSLAVFPGKYPIGKQNKFAKRNLHCAVFDNTYISSIKPLKTN